MVCPRANSQITWKCRDAVASSHPTYRSSKSSTLKCSQTVAMCPIPRLMVLKLICFARPCESPSNVESISRKSYDELNAWLTDKVIAYAKARPHPERPEHTIWEMFEEERPKLVAYRGRFDGFHT